MRFFLPVLLMFLPVAAFAAEPLMLSHYGKTEYVIVLPDEPIPVEQTAAKELQQHLHAVTAADFTIVKETEIDPAKPQIILGNTKRTKEL